MYSRLSPRDRAIVRSVNLHRQISAEQLLRLHFSDGSPLSRRKRSNRRLLSLFKSGQVARIERIGGVDTPGTEGYVYMPPEFKARTIDQHRLDIAEFGVRLTEADRIGALKLDEFWPEFWTPYTHLKPDGFFSVGGVRYFLEVDKDSEYESQLRTQMNKYVKAERHWPEDRFPFVLYTVPTSERKSFVERVAKKTSYPEMFKVELFDCAVNSLQIRP